MNHCTIVSQHGKSLCCLLRVCLTNFFQCLSAVSVDAICCISVCYGSRCQRLHEKRGGTYPTFTLLYLVRNSGHGTVTTCCVTDSAGRRHFVSWLCASLCCFVHLLAKALFYTGLDTV
ncbi:hypothetical protein TRVL_08508 [Trypanosoma vivax]|nr:hypothetical protein TRVL_08508 [Trypanosoma vivax]